MYQKQYVKPLSAFSTNQSKAKQMFSFGKSKRFEDVRAYYD